MRKILRSGFTLIEVMIALAIVIAIGAIISLNLMSRVSTAKIKIDIQSTRVLRSALDLYEAELQDPSLTKTDAGVDLEYLVNKNYISSSVLKSQAGGSWIYVNGKLCLLYTMNESITKAIGELSADEKSYIANAP